MERLESSQDDKRWFLQLDHSSVFYFKECLYLFRCLDSGLHWHLEVEQNDTYWSDFQLLRYVHTLQALVDNFLYGINHLLAVYVVAGLVLYAECACVLFQDFQVNVLVVNHKYWTC